MHHLTVAVNTTLRGPWVSSKYFGASDSKNAPKAVTKRDFLRNTRSLFPPPLLSSLRITYHSDCDYPRVGVHTKTTEYSGQETAGKARQKACRSRGAAQARKCRRRRNRGKEIATSFLFPLPRTLVYKTYRSIYRGWTCGCNAFIVLRVFNAPKVSLSVVLTWASGVRLPYSALDGQMLPWIATNNICSRSPSCSYVCCARALSLVKCSILTAHNLTKFHLHGRDARSQAARQKLAEDEAREIAALENHIKKEKVGTAVP